jgi:hypothetical protein
VGRSLVNGRSKSKPPILTLTPEQEREANRKIKRFMEDRFELDLGSFEAAEILELFTPKLLRTITTGRFSMCRRTSRSGSKASKATCGRSKN